ncbi:hypothetical protein PVK06_009379 [Gossypium arboreum]|uniref:Uncharacterized protein n=1 Tax=Gossypium arboreum TaxID=29729 RepID=A0ABR0QMH3_GOSAR|nr:hypothetical protein PVK06_009379 [Gossypium arboreum]
MLHPKKGLENRSAKSIRKWEYSKASGIDEKKREFGSERDFFGSERPCSEELTTSLNSPNIFGQQRGHSTAMQQMHRAKAMEEMGCDAGAKAMEGMGCDARGEGDKRKCLS